ncbi:MAG: valine--tRNA ligase [Chloroflexota bacterium]|nr:valine--tRNA ligase [Chloroflexota bacterium]
MSETAPPSPPSSAPPVSDLAKTYDPAAVEAPIYAMWESGGYFRPQARRPDGEPYCIIVPPPNVTGALHLGHALTTTIEDILIRWRRMLGDEALLLPGVDHAGIATQNVVEADIAQQGLSRHDIGREAFLERVWEWVARYRGRIADQQRRLGMSCDWDREVFTLDAGPQEAVRSTFRDLHAGGKVYRGHRIINWCPSCRTALSDLEVEYAEEPGTLWHVRYPFADSDGDGDGEGIVIATTRPETIPADVAVAVNPDDDRWRDVVGRRVRVPTPGIERAIPVIADAAVEIGFGSGALKITPGHDMLDFEIGERHDLPAISVVDWDGTMTPESGPYEGQDRDVAREAAATDLEASGHLVETQPHAHSVGHCQRCDDVVEPLISNQWFVDVGELAAKAAAVVREGEVRIVPERFAKVYLQWMDNIRPWCISRQLWWGHRIPAWYCLPCDGAEIQLSVPRSSLPEGGPGLDASPDGAYWVGSAAAIAAAGLPWDRIAALATDPTIGRNVTPIVAADDPAADGCDHCDQGALLQDPDVLDTWFSSGLWPHSTLGWPQPSDDLSRFYPGSVMETGYDILFFWVARMVMLGCHNMDGVPPFRTVYLHGLVRDAQGRKMSKSLGNGVDPLDVSDQFGTDALRFTLATGSSPGNDMRLTDERLQGSRNFVNKLWNGARFVLGELGDRVVAPRAAADDPSLALEDRWILSRLAALTAEVDDLLGQFQIGEAGRRISDFLWGDFFDWYVEASKVRLRAGDDAPLGVLAHVLDQGLRLLHPFLPFATEAIWQRLRPHLAGEDGPALIIAAYPRPATGTRDDAAERRFASVQEVVRAIRQVRADRGVEAPRWIEAYVVAGRGDGGDALRDRAAVIETLARARPLHMVATRAEAPDEQVVTQVLDRAEVVLPLGGLVDLARERARLDKQIAEAEGHEARIEAKLANPGFTGKAPAPVVARERERLAELQQRLDGLQERRADLGEPPSA